MRMIGILVLAVVLGACSQPPPPSQVCTLIGCESGLSVVVEPTPQGSYTVIAEAGDTTRTVECTAQRQCAEGAFFSDFTPTNATIRVIAGSDTTEQAVTPVYDTAQPNGPECPPTCRQGSVTVRTGDGNDAGR